MNQICSLVATAIVILSGFAAYAEPLSIACYGADHNLSVYVDSAKKGLTVTYKEGGADTSFNSTPSSWGDHNSYTTINKSAQEVRVIAQVLTGTEEAPIFDSSIDIMLKWNQSAGHFYVEAVELYRLSQVAALTHFKNTDTCYVQ